MACVAVVFKSFVSVLFLSIRIGFFCGSSISIFAYSAGSSCIILLSRLFILANEVVLVCCVFDLFFIWYRTCNNRLMQNSYRKEDCGSVFGKPRFIQYCSSCCKSLGVSSWLARLRLTKFLTW